MALGGARPGAGRKRKADEERVRGLAVKAIVNRFGSEEEGFAALLATGDPVLVKWVFEQAYGKPKERIEIDDQSTSRQVIDIGYGNNDQEQEQNGEYIEYHELKQLDSGLPAFEVQFQP